MWILNLAWNKSDIERRVHSIIDKFAERGLRSLGVARQIATLISATATWDFAGISKIGWRWTCVIWLYNIVTYMLFDPIKFAVRYALSGRAWSLVYNQRVSEKKTSPRMSLLQQLMTTQKDFGKEAREAARGQLSSEHFMASNLRKQKYCCPKSTLSGSLTSWQKKPEGVQRLQGLIKRALDKVPPQILMSAHITQSENGRISRSPRCFCCSFPFLPRVTLCCACSPPFE
ncbi:CALCIUM-TRANSPORTING ATPASE [Salix viminalis]|uniref:CALCIUM-TRANSPORTING ATPASE n=1 Tax=Salix viminalis TaxID=40686 RepID=A0A9Q0QCR7_SALVM|nr:CALCIUM-TRANSPORTING ATPASE [Salix viminalis]